MCGGGGGGTQTTQTIQSADPWSGVQPYLKKAYEDATSLYEQGGPQYYPGQTYVGATPTEIAGQNMALNYATGAMPQQVAGMLGAQQSLYNAPDVANNPYVGGMADVIQNRMTRQFTEEMAPAIRSGSIAAGQLGGSRQGLAEAQGMRNVSEATGDALAQLYGKSYETGLESAGRAMQLAPQTMQAGLMPAQAVQQVGQFERGEAELPLMDALNRWNFEQNAPQQNLSTYMNYLQGAPWSSSSTGTASMPGQGGFSGSGALGGAMMGGSMFGPLGALGGGLLGGFF